MQSSVSDSPFVELGGQRRAKSLLEKSLSCGRIAHAYLFRGPEGVGKTLFAAAMAKALNCRVSGPAGACGQCASCRKYDSGNHPDYTVEKPEKGVIKIERVRQLTKSLSFPPYESQWRVVVLEDIHTMRPEAANSLLKTLEEPPEGNVLILTAETSKSILPTMSSRCQIIPFFPLGLEETAVILRIQHNFDAEQAGLLARLAEGSPGKALLLHQTDMIATWRGVTEVLSNEELRSERHCATVMQWAADMADLKENLVPLLGLLRLWLRDQLDEIEDDEQQRHRGAKTQQRVFESMEAVDQAERQLARNCNRLLVCEMLLFRLQ
ncbi:MAG: DNA polymerase III subunit delta' [Desulfopila sp.]